MATFINYSARGALQFLRSHPPPMAGLGLTDLLSTDHFGFGPLLLRMDHRHFTPIPIALAELQIFNFPKFDVPLPRWVVKLLVWCFARAQRTCFLENVHPLLLEHHHPDPAQLVQRLQKGALDIPTINGEQINEARTVHAPNPA